MKTIKVTYIETYIVTEERIVEVSNATFKKLQKQDSEEYQRMYEEMNGVTCAIESPTERDQTFMDIELATEKDIEEVSYTLEMDFKMQDWQNQILDNGNCLAKVLG